MAVMECVLRDDGPPHLPPLGSLFSFFVHFLNCHWLARVDIVSFLCFAMLFGTGFHHVGLLVWISLCRSGWIQNNSASTAPGLKLCTTTPAPQCPISEQNPSQPYSPVARLERKQADRVTSSTVGSLCSIAFLSKAITSAEHPLVQEAEYSL